MARTLTLHKTGPSQFEETIETGGYPLVVKRRFFAWENVEGRLRQIGLETEEILRLKSAFDSGEDTALIRLPYRPGDAITI